MYARSLSTDCWQGTESKTNLVSDPSWQDIENAIKDLDGKVRTSAALHGEGEAHLAVGGGSSGRYLVYATSDNRHFSTLTNGQAARSKVQLYIGGQFGEYTDNLIVDIASALTAARSFAESGELDPTVPWLVK
jgi:hypothetical protein